MTLEEYKEICRDIYDTCKKTNPDIGFANAINAQVWGHDLVSTLEASEALLAISPSKHFIMLAAGQETYQGRYDAKALASAAMVRDVLVFTH